MKFNFNFKNTFNFDRARDWLNSVTTSANLQAAQYMFAQANLYCPVKTGNMKSTIRILKGPRRGSYSVVVTADYAQWVEFGHFSLAGNWVPGQFFMTQALEDTAQEYPRIAAGVSLRESHISYVGATF